MKTTFTFTEHQLFCFSETVKKLVSIQMTDMTDKLAQIILTKFYKKHLPAFSFPKHVNKVNLNEEETLSFFLLSRVEEDFFIRDVRGAIFQLLN